MKLSDYKALVFDCYGTLIDWESGMMTGLASLIEKAGFTLSRDAVLEAHARYESVQQAQTPGKLYQDLLPIVYKRLAEEWGVNHTHEEARTYGQSVKRWPAFPDTVEALAYLKQHFKLIILSNVDNASFADGNARLQVKFDAVYTAEDCGSYKPSDRNFNYFLDRLAALGLERKDILHTAESMFNDHAPPNKHGLANCWIYRRHDQEGCGATMNPGKMPKYDFVFNSMLDMAQAHKAELESLS